MRFGIDLLLEHADLRKPLAGRRLAGPPRLGGGKPRPLAGRTGSDRRHHANRRLLFRQLPAWRWRN